MALAPSSHYAYTVQKLYKIVIVLSSNLCVGVLMLARASLCYVSFSIQRPQENDNMPVFSIQLTLGIN